VSPSPAKKGKGNKERSKSKGQVNPTKGKSTKGGSSKKSSTIKSQSKPPLKDLDPIINIETFKTQSIN